MDRFVWLIVKTFAQIDSAVTSSSLLLFVKLKIEVKINSITTLLFLKSKFLFLFYLFCNSKEIKVIDIRLFLARLPKWIVHVRKDFEHGLILHNQSKLNGHGLVLPDQLTHASLFLMSFCLIQCLSWETRVPVVPPSSASHSTGSASDEYWWAVFVYDPSGARLLWSAFYLESYSPLELSLQQIVRKRTLLCWASVTPTFTVIPYYIVG